jgi:hypothetical protein
MEKVGSPGLVARGTLHAKGAAKSGRAYYNLMYRKDTVLHSRHVPAAEVALYRKATANYAELRRLFDAFVDELSERSAAEIRKEAGTCRCRR